MRLEVWPRMLEAPVIESKADIQDVFRTLFNNASRNQRIVDDILAAYQEGRKIIVLTGRTEHLSLLREMLGDRVEPCYVLHGRIPKKQRAMTLEELRGLNASTAFVLLATGSLIGEGFDHPPLDTLVLAIPISWKGTLQQYAGRPHREHAGKQDVRIYDYIEHKHPQLNRMWNKRLRGYQNMGYEVRTN
jgi:superfamily II DNA or RNA helicase